MKCINAIQFHRKSGVAEGSAVQRPFRGNVFSAEHSEVEGLPLIQP